MYMLHILSFIMLLRVPRTYIVSTCRAICVFVPHGPIKDIANSDQPKKVRPRPRL